MSSRLFKDIIDQMKDVIDREFGVADINGNVLACSDIRKEESHFDWLDVATLDSNKTEVVNGYTIRAIGKKNYEYILFVKGEDDISEKFCLVITVSISNIKRYYDEKYDKKSLIKNIVMDNIMPGDISVKARELHIKPDAYRAVFLIRTYNTNNFLVYDLIHNMFPDSNKDFVVIVDEHNTVLIKELKSVNEREEIHKISQSIVDTINSELLVKTYVGVGTIVDNINDIAKTFKEAGVALEVGKVFDTEKYIINYENLGIGRLIYQLPTTLCELFLKEVFKKKSIDALDSETILTIQRFFENNLNVSETSRKLYVHRNTLVYRLDKIQKITGLDLRIFDHAVVFKVAMMVKKYLDTCTMKI